MWVGRPGIKAGSELAAQVLLGVAQVGPALNNVRHSRTITDRGRIRRRFVAMEIRDIQPSLLCEVVYTSAPSYITRVSLRHVRCEMRLGSGAKEKVPHQGVDLETECIIY